MMGRLKALISAFWPYGPGRAAVLHGYAVLGREKHVLTDIALRNFVYAPAPPAETLWAAGLAEGRRQAALEILRLAGERPDRLATFIEHAPEKEPRRAA